MSDAVVSRSGVAVRHAPWLAALRRRWLTADSAILLFASFAALGLKHAYSSAGAAELRWILGPTARLVGLATGTTLHWEAGAGYLGQELGVLVTPGCAGINFLIVVLLSLVFGLTRRLRGRGKLAWLAASAGLSYLATLLVNTTRIVLSARLLPLATGNGMSFEQAHRIEGVLVYLMGLLLVYQTASAVLTALGHTPKTRRLPLSTWLLPVGVYLGVTLGIPALRGAASGTEFWAHAASLMATSALVVIAVSLIAAIRTRRYHGAARWLPENGAPRLSAAVRSGSRSRR